jgi:hypothetical protein
MNANKGIFNRCEAGRIICPESDHWATAPTAEERKPMMSLNEEVRETSRSMKSRLSTEGSSAIRPFYFDFPDERLLTSRAAFGRPGGKSRDGRGRVAGRD